MPFEYSVFTKPWPLPAEELARKVKDLGFDNIELPVRAGFPVTPENVSHALPAFAKELAEAGIRIRSIAADPTAEIVAACAKANVAFIRIMVRIHESAYMKTEREAQARFAQLLPLLQDHGVAVGVQNHSGDFISNAMGLRHLLEPFPPEHLCAFFDVGHNALDGEQSDLALDILLPWIKAINLKNPRWVAEGIAPSGNATLWRKEWTLGHLGFASWPALGEELAKRGWSGLLCLSAEYSDMEQVEAYTAKDLALAKRIFAEQENKSLQGATRA